MPSVVHEAIDERYANPDEGLHAIRKFAFNYILKERGRGWFARRDVYQFGVWCGHSLSAMQTLCDRLDLTPSCMWGFDSFEGLPEEKVDKNNNKDWKEGAFSCKEGFGVQTVDEAMEGVLDRMPDQDINLILIPGFWDKVLTDARDWADCAIASYIDIDADQYSSSKIALRWALRNKVLQIGTLVGYHDWDSTPIWEGGESLAHWEVTRQFRLRWKRLFDNGSTTVFVLTEICALNPRVG